MQFLERHFSVLFPVLFFFSFYPISFAPNFDWSTYVSLHYPLTLPNHLALMSSYTHQSHCGTSVFHQAQTLVHLHT
ncbi:dubious [Schizosaccharomyces pombe]|uniref:Uncharacterized protein SPBC713.14c n=1 Tax=Schizosaccharomyces pombe (strain 972 / ATCC 24843) TaxID=284812 RepID=YN5E_SCHPO|nr:RecName: Full=Uncharacterized protein SPBC713.14c; Flags: Precursor [Schizosaccharomyces pombe 972h-]